MSLADARSESAFAEHAPSSFPVNVRITLPFFRQRYFLTLIIGPERRGIARRKEERARHPLNTWGNLLTFAASWTIFTVAALFFASVMATL